MALEKWKGKAQLFLKNKYALAVLLLGLVLLLLPRCSADPEAEAPGQEEITAPSFSVAEQEEKLSQALSSIRGAGETKVLLSLRGGVERELAEEDGQAVIVSAGSGVQSPVALRYVYPEYRGALVICQGAGDPNVRLAVTEAVRAVTGLGSNQITVVQMDA